MTSKASTIQLIRDGGGNLLARLRLDKLDEFLQTRGPEMVIARRRIGQDVERRLEPGRQVLLQAGRNVEPGDLGDEGFEGLDRVTGKETSKPESATIWVGVCAASSSRSTTCWASARAAKSGVSGTRCRRT